MATILIASPNEGELGRIVSILAHEGYECLSCRDGEGLKKLLDSSKIDLVISEVDLPGLNTFDLMRILETASNGQGIPLIVGHASSDADGSEHPGSGFHWMGVATSPDELVGIVTARLELGAQERVSGHILVVDDDRELRELIARRLKVEGYQTSTALDGEDGLQAMEKNPDLVLTDIAMPRLDGFDFLIRLRADSQYAHVPVIMMTAHADSGEDAAHGLKLGANDYVRKPFNWVELMARVQTQLRVQKVHRLTVERQRDLAVIELAGAAAHEINNPLAVVTARLELMRERMNASDEFYDDIVKLDGLLDSIAGIVKKMGQVRRYQVRNYCGGVNILDLDGASERMER